MPATRQSVMPNVVEPLLCFLYRVSLPVESIPEAVSRTWRSFRLESPKSLPVRPPKTYMLSPIATAAWPTRPQGALPEVLTLLHWLRIVS